MLSKRLTFRFWSMIGCRSARRPHGQGVAELKRGVESTLGTIRENTALDQASEYGHADVVKVLLEHGAIPDATASGGGTPLMAAAEKWQFAGS